MANPEDHWMERGSEIERTVFFSDAVFAIAITLLALEIRVPEIPSGSAASSLPAELLELSPQFLSFLISFWIVGNYWLAHHRIFHYIRAYDRNLLLINLLFLMWIVLLPFSSSLLGEYGDQQIAAIIYALHIVVSGLTLSWLWRYASRDPRLMDTAQLDAREVRYNDLRGIAIPLIFLFSIAVSFFSVWVAEGLWLLTFLVRPWLMRMFGGSAV